EKHFKNLKESIKERVLEVLRKSNNYPGIKLVTIRTPGINAKLARRWARKHLKRKEYLSLFVPAFDCNRFNDLVEEKKINKKKLPKGIFFTSTSEQVRPSEIKE